MRRGNIYGLRKFFLSFLFVAISFVLFAQEREHYFGIAVNYNHETISGPYDLDDSTTIDFSNTFGEYTFGFHYKLMFPVLTNSRLVWDNKLLFNYSNKVHVDKTLIYSSTGPNGITYISSTGAGLRASQHLLESSLGYSFSITKFFRPYAGAGLRFHPRRKAYRTDNFVKNLETKYPILKDGLEEYLERLSVFTLSYNIGVLLRATKRISVSIEYQEVFTNIVNNYTLYGKPINNLNSTQKYYNISLLYKIKPGS